MADTPVFQGHHVIEQAAFSESRLLQSLSRSGLFDLHGARNILNLPADQALAAKMGLSPHPGGPLGAYSEELANRLERLELSPTDKQRCAAIKPQHSASRLESMA